MFYALMKEEERGKKSTEGRDMYMPHSAAYPPIRRVVHTRFPETS
jgi:hypothetical protein